MKKIAGWLLLVLALCAGAILGILVAGERAALEAVVILPTPPFEFSAYVESGSFVC